MDDWRPVQGDLLTRWAKDVTPDNVWPWPEYPRPQMTRHEWLNLNGYWEFGIASIDLDQSVDFGGRILVPFPLESALSGVKRALGPDERLWYRRTFTLPKKWGGRRILLHFGAVDWEATVWVNGQLLGTHRGGYLPFSFDITAQITDSVNELVVAVWDPTDSSWQQRGKQVLKPKSIWYTAVSGIWQTVWLEPVPETYIKCLRITPDLDGESVSVGVALSDGPAVTDRVHVRVSDAGRPIAEGQSKDGIITLSIPHPKPWSPDSPHLYDLTVTAGHDKVGSYFGMRKFGLGKDEKGRTRLCLNNRPLFQFGPLDQGYWPDGLYTPPTDEAMLKDIELVKSLGFNMLRKHVKVEPARYYYHCDRLGLIVWQDMPNGGSAVGDVTSFLAILFGSRRRDRNYRYAGRAEPGSREDCDDEIERMVEHLYNFPCIGMWVPFNEGWGQYDANRIAARLKEVDPTRPVDHASGWFDQGGGDCKSLHVYFKKLPIIRPEQNRAVVLSEFGGYSLKFDGHSWDPSAEFGYKKFTTPAALTDAYLELLKGELEPWVEAGLSAAVYTQTTDVEIEVNGFVTYDREVEKMDFERLRQAHLKLSG
ncbi:MAG TPA: glycoside hydrolase family 2 TIM barrel-domain containing protein [Anaerolineales bacterium]|nr:glycoside hydrolase family 2 TIM barrel-domain containing protein [Anaerolineales bacterium]